ncbi:inactive hydroxysteroid dehydrogenase-like protein 1 isoform X2 [Amyelois transitella]|uniref:inactive hydroxysteroid dehydrogenase-like protein 1 isoform X2 n=1 Tax=Amyelois transitella TaxID=680683 RepID=UPI00067C3F65|nr:inactive hydroxysteroid dehydrogenase-like protein 1 isoform X2 [Amyelois transitella]
MLQVIVFTLVGILFVLAALEVIVRACVTTEKRDWRRCIVISAVTGSTDGIGKQYALELARRGCSVVLISRNQDKLNAVASQIEKEHNVKTKTIVADFSRGAEAYAKIEEELRDVPVGILVNNVGINYDYPCLVCELPQSKVWEIININVGAVTMMTRTVLPGMVARGRGAIVNVSSGSELQPLPLMTIYAATKAYIRSFTLALREEYAPKGIHVQHLSPMFVSTKINSFSQKLLEGNLLVPDAETYSRSAVETLGRVHNTTGFWLHGIQYFFIKLTPEWIRIKIGIRMNKKFRQEYSQTHKTKVN